MAVGAALLVEGLGYAYPGGSEVLAEVSFSIPAGQRVALLGPNGAGKSTLLWCLVGVLRGTGKVVVGGTELARGSESEVRTKLGLAFAEPDDQLFMPTVLRDVMFGPRAAGEPTESAEAQARDVAGRVGLAEGLLQREPHELSSGEKRRAALAAILTSEPTVLALDEPTNSLDAPGRAALADTLAALPCAQLIATHDLDFARALCSRALVLAGGRVAADEELEGLLSDERRLVEYGLVARRQGV
jgi:cobalt/nickel transport system ATP-binding protein